MAIEFVDLPIKNGKFVHDFSSFFVCLPPGSELGLVGEVTSREMSGLHHGKDFERFRSVRRGFSYAEPRGDFTMGKSSGKSWGNPLENLHNYMENPHFLNGFNELNGHVQ